MAVINGTPTTSGTSSGLSSMSVASGVLSGLTSIANSIINVQNLKNISKFNAGIADAQKRIVNLSAKTQIKRIRQQADSLLSSQRVGYAKAGFSLSGSPLAVMLSSQKDAELDAIYTQINADLGISAVDTGTAISKIQTQSAIIDQYMNAGSSILSTSNRLINR